MEYPTAKWGCESLIPVGTYLRDVPPRTGMRRNARLRDSRILVGMQRFADAPSCAGAGGTSHPRVRRAGFTLIELLVTLAIILLLAGLVLGGLSTVATKARKAKARTQVAQIATAWTQYLNDYKVFPRVGGSDLTEMNDAALRILTGDNPKHFTYLDFRSTTTAYNDPWRGSPVPYQFLLDYDLVNRVEDSGRGIPELRLTVAVWSVGPDRTSGTDDDVTNWK